MGNILDLIFYNSSGTIYPKALSKLPSEWDSVADKIDGYNNKFKGEISVILGPWGSGKSTLISTLVSQSRGPFKCCYQRTSFNIASTTDEAHLLMIRPWLKFAAVLFSILGVCFSYYYTTPLDTLATIVKDNLTATIILAILALLLFANKYRILYLLFSIVESVFFFRKTKVFEDFDRSSLDASQIYAVMSYRNKWRTTFILPLGYHSEIQRDEYLEIAMKLEAQIIHLGLNSQSLEKIAKAFSAEFPFSGEAWLELLPPRRLLNILESLSAEFSQMNESDRYFMYLQTFFDYLVKTLNFKVEEINFGRRTLSHTEGMNAFQSKIFESFFKSINWTDFETHVPASEKESATWKDNVLHNLFKRVGKFATLPAIKI